MNEIKANNPFIKEDFFSNSTKKIIKKEKVNIKDITEFFDLWKHHKAIEIGELEYSGNDHTEIKILILYVIQRMIKKLILMNNQNTIEIEIFALDCELKVKDGVIWKE